MNKPEHPNDLGDLNINFPDTWDIWPKYVFQKELGHGTYGSVCEAIVAGTNVHCAIKKFTNIYKDALMCKRVLREIEIIYYMNHPCIVKPIDMFLKESDIYLVMELGQTDLRKLIKGNVYLTEKQVKVVMYRILLAINYMHSAGIIHRDVKPANILINSDCSIKLCDFSLSRSIAGLNSSIFDCDQAIRYNPMLNGSGSCASNPSMRDIPSSDPKAAKDMAMKALMSATASSTATTDSVSQRENAGPNDFEEGMNGTNKIVHCDFQVKKLASKGRTDYERLETSCPYIPDEGEEGVPIAPATERKPAAEKKKTLHAMKEEQREVLQSRSKEYTPCLQRELTGHVATRWYRSPEVILLEKIYTTSVDIWSTGCVFAELLQMIKEVEPDVSKRRPLFPGASCYPLSPSHRPTINITDHPISPCEQMNLIFKALGNPTKADLAFLSDESAVEYVQGFPRYKKQGLQQMFRSADAKAVELLEKMLMFNPYHRITAKEALRHKYFADVRDKSQEIELLHTIPLVTDSFVAPSLTVLTNEVLRRLFGC